VGQAADALGPARRLADLPDVADAARRGALSPQQTSAIADAAAVDPGAERRLLEQARRETLSGLREACRRTKAAADRDAEERRKRIHAERFLRRYTDGEGAGNLHLRDNPEVIAQVMAAIAP